MEEGEDEVFPISYAGCALYGRISGVQRRGYGWAPPRRRWFRFVGQAACAPAGGCRSAPCSGLFIAISTNARWP